MTGEPTVELDGHTVALSHTDRVVFPDSGHTKGDVIDHYRRVAEAMVPHTADRPLTLHRFPGGIGQSGFYQKAASGHFPGWVHSAELERRGDHATIRHPLADDAASLVYLANQGTIEFHVWTSAVAHPERPDRLVVDLDPPEGTDLADIRAAARATRALYEEVGLVPHLQTSGSRAYHVVAPLTPTAGFDLVGPLAHGLALQLSRRDPDRLTAEGRKAKRGDRIYLDVARNSYGQMIVAPYSLRARPAAPVATPIEWSELSRVKPQDFRIDNIGRRLARTADPWAGIADDARSPIDAYRRLQRIARS